MHRSDEEGEDTSRKRSSDEDDSSGEKYYDYKRLRKSAPETQPAADKIPVSQAPFVQAAPQVKIETAYQRHLKKYAFSCIIGGLTWFVNDVDIKEVVERVGVFDLLEVDFFESLVNGQSKGYCVVSVDSLSSLRKLLDKLPKEKVFNYKLIVKKACNETLEFFESQPIVQVKAAAPAAKPVIQPKVVAAVKPEIKAAAVVAAPAQKSQIETSKVITPIAKILPKVAAPAAKTRYQPKPFTRYIPRYMPYRPPVKRLYNTPRLPQFKTRMAFNRIGPAPPTFRPPCQFLWSSRHSNPIHQTYQRMYQGPPQPHMFKWRNSNYQMPQTRPQQQQPPPPPLQQYFTDSSTIHPMQMYQQQQQNGVNFNEPGPSPWISFELNGGSGERNFEPRGRKRSHDHSSRPRDEEDITD